MVHRSPSLQGMHDEPQISTYPGNADLSQWDWVLFDCDGVTELASGSVTGPESKAWAEARAAKAAHYMETKGQQ